MMAEDDFWKLVEAKVIRKSDGSIDATPLGKDLAKMSPDDILSFHQRLSKYYLESYTWALWGAAYLIHEGAPDDTFDYFRSWLIGQGRKIFMAAMRNPDSLADVATAEALDDLLYRIADTAFESVTGKPIPRSGFKRPTLKKDLDFKDPGAMARVYPKLFQRFGGMYAQGPEDELLDRCRKVAGASGRWTTENLAGFFHRFRPDGKGLSKIYSGMEHGKEISKRLIAVMKVDGTTEGSTLAANKLIAVDPKRARALVKRFCANIQSLAHEVDDEELAERFTVNKLVTRAGMRTDFSSNDGTREAMEMLCDSAYSILYDCTATASVLDRAVCTLVGFTPLAFYIQWPICADKFRTFEPFKPWFDLWRRGVAWRFVSANDVEVFTP